MQIILMASYRTFQSGILSGFLYDIHVQITMTRNKKIVLFNSDLLRIDKKASYSESRREPFQLDC